MSGGKIVYGPVGEEVWANVRNFMNTKFCAQGPCSLCRATNCGMVWYSIKTKEVRCMECFTPERHPDHPDGVSEWDRKHKAETERMGSVWFG